VKIKALLKTGVVIGFLCLAPVAVAQIEAIPATRVAELQELAASLQERDEIDRQQAREYASRVGIPLRRELPGGRVLELQRIVPGAGPVFYITNNVDAADTVSSDEVWPGGSAGLDLDGGGMTAGEWDGGAIYAGHPDFTGRLTQVDGATVVSGHSTHVAGTLIGAGDWLDQRSRGMAYAAQLDAYDWNSDTSEMAFAAAGGLLVSNHSYGIAAGWLYIGGAPPDAWWWIGGDQPSDIEDPNFGYYDAESQLWDQIAFDAPYYLIVKASGNDRTDIGPTPGEEYWVIDQDGNFLFTSTLPRNADCAPAGYDCLPTHSVAKNILTVGAVDDIPGGYSPLSGPSSVQMASFSSWGPSDDGRIKPDVVGNGVFLISAWPDSPYYAAAAGTSMAAPNVTGSLLLLQEHYEDIHGGGNFMRGATLKALAIHTADEAGNDDGPDYAFGWGLLNTRAAAEVITEDGNDHRIIEGSLAESTVDSVQVSITKADDVLSATLTWMDPPGTPVAPALDPPDLMLVNDLDLRIKKNPVTYMPWVLNPAVPAAAATTGDNIRDNVEQVVVSGGGTGTYTVEVSHKGALLNAANQDYSLIISVEPALPTGSGLLIDEDFSGGLPPGWSLETATNPIVNWAIKTPIPGGSRLDNLTGGSGQFAMADFRYQTDGAASLRTPLLDLSSNTAATLRFKSQYNYDTWESLNVDASTNGGTNWFNVWNFQGFNPFPNLYVLDLSGAIAGQGSVRLRFRFDSEFSYSGDYWQIDDVELEVFGGATLPGQAANPNPADTAIDVDVNANLGWSAGSNADSHDVYFGISPTPTFQGNQAGTSFEPGTLDPSTTYVWRIDEVNATGITTGTQWSFTTEDPAPAIHLGNLGGISEPARRGRWNALVTVTVEDADGAPVAGATAVGNWSNGATGSDTCASVTDASGQCTVTKQNLKDSVPSVVFTVTNLTAAGATYDSGANEVPATVTVFKDAPPPLPGLASNPSPGDGATSVSVDANLGWSAGSNTDSHDVYFGTDPSPDAGEFQGNQSGAGFEPGTLAASTAYFWRIDEVNGTGTTAGAVWSFTTGEPPPLPGTAGNPSPADGANGVSVNVNLGWSAGANATSHDVYFGTDPSPAFQGNQGSAGFDPGTLAASTTYYWRIDEVNGTGTTAGALWGFTTENVPPPNRTVTVTHFKDRGNHRVRVNWDNFTDGPTVDITRISSGSPTLVADNTPNDGEWIDTSFGKKSSGTYTYEVCDSGGCSSDTISF
jgi:hypothetical protein